MISVTATYQRKPGIVTRHIAGETILVPVANNLADLRRIFVLNAVGEFIWERLDGVVSLAGIAQQVAESFGVEPGQAEADCLAFVRELEAAGLVSGS